MVLPEHVLEKIDRGLAVRLREARGSETVRVVARLMPAPEGDRPLDPARPADYPSRLDYRRHLLQQRWREVNERHGRVIERMRDAGVRVLSGILLESVVLEGTPQALVDALALDGVSNAELDRSLALP